MVLNFYVEFVFGLEFGLINDKKERIKSSGWTMDIGEEASLIPVKFSLNSAGIFA